MPDELDASVAADEFDAASCDPLFFEQPRETTPENIAQALQWPCFHSGAERRRLVIEALCTRDTACDVSHTQGCRDEYEARWLARQGTRGLPVPCADALLDAMSCIAQASCDGAHTCDALAERAEAACDPNAPLPGAPTCPPLPEDRELTKGPIPDNAITDAGRYDENLIPDFVAVAGQGVEIVGYIRFCARRTGGAIPVYADDLKTVIGYMIPGTGFVPGPLH
ncbi:MAG: hypothetical protein ABW321_33085 [Polyangiales bacterium]